MKKQEGITLIAIIITIIIMLILAGVTVSSSIGNNGVLKNSEKASTNIKKSEGKEFILEAWAYVLSKSNNNEVPYIDNSENRKIQQHADSIFRTYISNYGKGYLEENGGKYIYSIIVNGENVEAFKVNLTLKGEKESKVFYIVNDKNIYSEDEVTK